MSQKGPAVQKSPGKPVFCSGRFSGGMYNRPCRIPAFGSVRKNNGIFCGDLKSFPARCGTPKSAVQAVPTGFSEYTARQNPVVFSPLFCTCFPLPGKPAFTPAAGYPREKQQVPNSVVFSYALSPALFLRKGSSFPYAAGHPRGNAMGTKSSCFFVCPFPLQNVRPFHRADAFSPVRASDHAAAKSRTGTRFLCCCKGKWQLPSRQALGEVLSSSRALPKGFSPAFSAVHPDRTALLPIPAGGLLSLRALRSTLPTRYRTKCAAGGILPLRCLIRPAAPVSRPTVWVAGQWQGTAGNSCNRAQVFAKEQAHFAKLWLSQFP